MTRSELQAILDNPATSPRERRAALGQIRRAESKPNHPLQKLVTELLVDAGQSDLADVGLQQFHSFARKYFWSDEIKQLEDIYSAALTAAYWKRYFAGQEELPEPKLVKFLYGSEKTEEELCEIGRKELADAQEQLSKIATVVQQ